MQCKPIAKYDLETKNWREVREGEAGKAFSVVKCNKEFGKKALDEKEDFEYFILLDGTRVENYSNKGEMDGKPGYALGKYLSELEQSSGRIKVESILVDNDGPLEEEAKLLANHVNKIKKNNKCKKVTILGASKCGCISIAMLKYLTDANLDKLDVICYSAPYLGTILASPLALYDEVDKKVEYFSNSLLNKVIPLIQKIRPNSENQKIDIENSSDNKGLVKALKNMHWNVFSQSHMDYDIALLGIKGVPEEHADRYDEKFLKNMFDERTLERLNKVHVTNVTCECSKETLKNCAKDFDKPGILLYISDKLLFDKPSDGMVELSSAKYIEDLCREKGIKIDTQTIIGGHHDISSNARIIHKVLESRIKTKDRQREIGE